MRRVDLYGAVAFGLLWGGSTAYLGATGADWTFPFIALGIFAIGLSAIAWLTTRGAKTVAPEIRRPSLESVALLVYLALYAILFLGYGMSALRDIPAGRSQELVVVGAKLLVHVVLPAVLLLALGAKLKPLVKSQLPSRQFWLTFVVLGAIITALLAVLSPSLSEIGAVSPSLATLAWAAPASFVWLAVEAGLNEEFLFRGVLQPRLSAWAKSDVTGIAVTSVIFGLAHAPGLFLRGGPGVDGWSSDPVQVIAFTIATLAPLSVFFGFLYARTRSLLLCVLLHAAVDFLPNMAEFLRIWG
ncbi:MAG TPA: CPBP family intramembrane glutamic endopeptidase [Gammaproteobacteria bacterium]